MLHQGPYELAPAPYERVADQRQAACLPESGCVEIFDERLIEYGLFTSCTLLAWWGQMLVFRVFLTSRPANSRQTMRERGVVRPLRFVLVQAQYGCA